MSAAPPDASRSTDPVSAVRQTPIAGAERSRDAGWTRSCLLKAARARLVAHGYGDVSLRDIAADVGVDVALINRYFGSKDALFLAVLETEAAGAGFFDGDPATFGERIAAAAIPESDGPRNLEGLMVLIRSIGSERGRALSGGRPLARFQDPLIAWLKGEDRVQRALLISTLVIGAAVTGEIGREGPCALADRDQTRSELAALIQTLADMTSGMEARPW